MKKAVTFMLVFALALTMAGFVRNSQAAAKTMKGEVISVDIDAKTVILMAKKGEVTFTVDDKTRILMGRQHKAMADLKVGKKCRVSYHVVDGKNVASKIVIPAPSSIAPDEQD
jgi:hypothetical protein